MVGPRVVTVTVVGLTKPHFLSGPLGVGDLWGGELAVSDADGMAIEDDEDFHIPAELVTITGQIGPDGVREVDWTTICPIRPGYGLLEVRMTLVMSSSSHRAGCRGGARRSTSPCGRPGHRSRSIPADSDRARQSKQPFCAISQARVAAVAVVVR